MFNTADSIAGPGQDQPPPKPPNLLREVSEAQLALSGELRKLPLSPLLLLDQACVRLPLLGGLVGKGTDPARVGTYII